MSIIFDDTKMEKTEGPDLAISAFVVVKKREIDFFV